MGESSLGGEVGVVDEAEHAAAHSRLLEVMSSLPDGILVIDGRPCRWLLPALNHSRFHRGGFLEPALQRVIKLNAS